MRSTNLRYLTWRHHLTGLLLILLLAASACNKEKNNPRHEDIFRCEINGVPWEAGCESNNIAWGCIAIDCQYYEETGGFEIGANKKETTSGISFRKSSNDGGVVIGDNLFTKMIYGHEGVSYTMNNGDTGLVQIFQIDFDLKIIEGEFNFKAFSNLGDSVFVSKGYFKVKYRP